MFLETERKIITSPAVFDHSNYFTVRRVFIEQTYISTRKWCEIRLRVSMDDYGIDKRELTIKLPLNKFRRVEVNIPMPTGLFKRLFRHFKKKGSIQKIRSYYENTKSHEISLDFYLKPINLYVAEIESPDPYKLPMVPHFLDVGGVEVSGDENFSNRMIFRNFFSS